VGDFHSAYSTLLPRVFEVGREAHKGTFINVCFFPHTIDFRAPRCGPLSPCRWLPHPIRTDAANMLKEEKYLTE